MDIILKNELDPLFEILGLLYLCHNPDWKEETIKSLDEYGLKGDEFFQAHMKILETYVDTFKKYKTDGPQDSFFFEQVSDDSFHLLIAMAIENRYYYDHPAEIDCSRLRGCLAYLIEDPQDHPHLPDEKDLPRLPDELAILQFLDSADIKTEEKWHTLELLRKPDYWITCLFDTVRANTDAYDRAIAAVKKPLEKLLKRTAVYEDPPFLKIAGTCADAPIIYISLVAPMVLLVLYTHGYQGILLEALRSEDASGKYSSETIIRQAKSLSDKSKLDILCILKNTSMYNLELAEALGLSPSTTSHHMNALLTCGFVTVEKKEGKVYYCLEKENIAQFLSILEHMLLS